MVDNVALLIANTSTPDDGPLLDVCSPYDQSLIARVSQANAQHIDAALTAAYAVFRDRNRWLPLLERVAILERLAELMNAEEDSLALAAAQEGGKPLMDSKVEVARAIAGIKLCIEHINADAGVVVPMPEASADTLRVAFTQKEPVGVVVAVSAFNHPLNLIVHQVGAAVAAGCPVIVKPADDTPLSCLRFVTLLHEAGLPLDFCQVVLPESLALATSLVSDSRVGFFSFIGSARVGWMLRSKLAPGTRAALEHGGVAPVIIDDSGDLTKALPAVLKGGFYHAGQVCVSVQRVYVPSVKAQEFATQLAELALSLKVGDPLQATTEVGPLIREAEVQRVHEWVSQAVEDGAELLCGGKVLDNNCYAPTVLLNPSDSANVSCMEIFGPVVCVYGYDDIDDAIAKSNGLDVAFQAAVFCQDIDKALSIYTKLDASAVMLNEHTAFRVDGMPFAGLRHSGLGVGGIGHTIDDMQIDKMLMIKSQH